MSVDKQVRAAEFSLACNEIEQLAKQLNLFPRHLHVLARHMADGNEGAVFKTLLNFAICEKRMCAPVLMTKATRGVKRGTKRTTESRQRQVEAKKTQAFLARG